MRLKFFAAGVNDSGYSSDVPKAKARTAEAESNIHAIVGSDESEVKRVAAELAAKLAPSDAGEFGLEVIDACADNVDQAVSRIRSAIEALQTLPFFGGGKLVWLKNANCLGDSPIGRSASVQSALDDLAGVLDAGLGSEVTLLISATEVDKRRSFYKTLGKRAELQVIDRLDSSRAGWEEEATEIVRRRAKSRKLQFEEEALDLFVLLTGGNTRQIENELEKIDLYLGRDRQVGVEQVRELVPLSRAGVIFELGNALAACDLERALTLVKRLLDQGETAIGILLVAILPDDPQFASRERSNGTARDPTSARPFHLHFRAEPFAGRGDGAFAAEKRWLDQWLCPWPCGTAGASVRDPAAHCRPGSLPRSKSAARHQPARSRISPDRDRGETAGCASLVGRGRLCADVRSERAAFSR